jgi:acetyl-CoA carboxylase carboxyltransferase component
MAAPAGPARLPVATQREGAVRAELRELEGQLVGFFHLEGGKHRGAIGPVEGETIRRLAIAAVDAGAPIVGVLATSGADVTEGVASLHAWGGVARALAQASGVVPIVLIVTGPCVSGPALLLGLADVVVMTLDAFAYVSGPSMVAGFTGVSIGHAALGGAAVHAVDSGVASIVAEDEDEALLAAADVLSYLPDHNLSEPPVHPTDDPIDRLCTHAAAVVPTSPSESYDMRDVIADVADAESVLELRPYHAANLVTALGRVGGIPVGFVANQPAQLAGTIDIKASQKGARFVQWCDAFNLPLVSLVDTGGFQPGKDLEWRGMIRHGAELVHAYAEASVPRVSVILRKAYGGAYIVMDSKALGSDLCVAWPRAEIAVVGAEAAVEILYRRHLTAIDDDAARLAERAALEQEYADRLCSATLAVERGYVDELIDPTSTRLVVASALRSLQHKRDHPPRRRHSNSPL